MERIFLLIHAPTPSTSFPLKGYASASRRFDIVARVALAALTTADGVRRDTRLYVYLHDTGKLLEVGAAALAGVSGGEAQVLALLRDMLGSAPTVDFGEVLEAVAPEGYARLYLTEEGAALGEMLERLCSAPGVVVVLGGKEDVPQPMVSELVSRGFTPVSIGPYSYLSSHCVSYMQMVLDGCATRPS